MVQILPKVPSFGETMGAKLGEGIGQGLQTLMGALAQRKQQKETTAYFKKLAEEHPGEKNYELLANIASSPLQADQKRDFLKALLQTDPYRAEQQDRLRKDAISQQYGRAIKEIDSALEKRIYSFGSPEFKQAIGLRQKLAEERDRLLGLGMGAEEPDMEESEMFEEEEEIPQKRKETPIKKKPQSKREKFDVNNSRHKTRRDEVLKKTGGDRKKAAMVLAKEFDL